MRTALIVLILGLAANSVMSACVANGNYITTTLGMTASEIVAEANKVSITTLTQCGITTATDFCIAESGLGAKLQARIDALRTTLQTAAGVRDKYIIAQRGEVIKSLDSLRRLDAIASASNVNKIPDAYKAIGEDFLGYATTIADNFTAVVANFDDYQTARQTCMNSLLKVQGAILCESLKSAVPASWTHATDAAGSTIPIHDNTLNTLSTDCWNYIDYSERQSAIISAAVFSSGLSRLANGLEKLFNNDASGAAEDILAAFTEFNKTTYSTTAGQEAVELPHSTNKNCVRDTKNCNNFIENVLFAKGIIVNADAIMGGEKVTKPAFSVARVLESEGNDRRLAAAGFEPALANYAFTISFEKNPGGVDNTENAKSALRNGIVACAVAALALFF